MLDPLVDGEVVPFGRAIAFFDPLQDCYWTAPIPLHWVVRYVRRSWEWCARYQLSSWESEMKEAIETAISARLETERTDEDVVVDVPGVVAD